MTFAIWANMHFYTEGDGRLSKYFHERQKSGKPSCFCDIIIISL